MIGLRLSAYWKPRREGSVGWPWPDLTEVGLIVLLAVLRGKGNIIRGTDGQAGDRVTSQDAMLSNAALLLSNGVLRLRVHPITTDNQAVPLL